MNQSRQLLEEFCEIVGEKNVLTDDADLIPYGFDGTAALSSRPGYVVLPGSTAEVAACVQLANTHDLKVTTRGSGTGLSGGSVPEPEGLVLCLVRMNQILEVDSKNLTLKAQCGVITAKVDQEARKVGLFYPPDPGSMKISTIGGNVANNSGGLRGLKYGVTRDYVMGLEVVLPNGQIAKLGNRCVKDVAGYSMKDLFVGSEGTLGIITEVLLKLLPIPEKRATLLASFPTLEQGAQAVSAIIAAKIIPCTLEFLDQMTIRCVEEFVGIGLPTQCAALLLMETDGHPVAVDDEVTKMAEIAKRHGAIEVTQAKDEEQSLQLASARRTAFSALARVRPTTILEDVTVPRSHLAEMVSFIDTLAREHGLTVGTFGHMGDGNLHPTFLTDERDEDEMRRVHLALDAIVKKTLELGGTITGEHGIGLAKKGWLREQVGEASYDLMRLVKQSIDPRNLLNPGKIFD